MNCPVCNVELRMTDRQAVEVNYCPKCRGVWLEHGGLDKIIDRSAGNRFEPEKYDLEREHHGHDTHHGGEYRGHRKRSFFSGLFDD